MAEPILEDFAGEERPFLIRIGELRRIQTACGAGPGEVANRLARCVKTLREFPKLTVFEQALIGMGHLYVDDVRAPIYEGLVAGGMTAPEASKLVRAEIDDRGFRGLVENAGLALGVLISGVSMPAEDDDAGELKPGENPPAASSTSESFTPPAVPSDISNPPSTPAASGNSSKPSGGGAGPPWRGGWR